MDWEARDEEIHQSKLESRIYKLAVNEAETTREAYALQALRLLLHHVRAMPWLVDEVDACLKKGLNWEIRNLTE